MFDKKETINFGDFRIGAYKGRYICSRLKVKIISIKVGKIVSEYRKDCFVSRKDCF